MRNELVLSDKETNSKFLWPVSFRYDLQREGLLNNNLGTQWPVSWFSLWMKRDKFLDSFLFIIF